MKSILFVLFFVLSVAAFFACYAEAGDRVSVRQPFFRPNTTIIRQQPQQIVVQPRQQIVVQQHRQNFVFAQPQAFVLQQPQQFFFQQPQAFSFGGHVQQFSAPGCNGNCPSALLFR